MLVPINTEIIIKSAPEKVWDYAHDPKNWTASNPTEHFGLKFDAPDDRPHTGVQFEQVESVAGVKAILRGHIPLAKRPELLFWRGVATYRVKGFTVRIPEGGVLLLEVTGEGTRLVHDVWMDFPPSLKGRMAYKFFKRRNVEKAIYDHTYRELQFFKEKLETT